MFTGIVKSVGRVVKIERIGGDRRYEFGLNGLDPPALGASIAVNGVCLTAIDSTVDAFRADVSAETLAVTTLARLEIGDPINLEPALRLGDALGGHWVIGHVDGIGRVTELRQEARSSVLEIELPLQLRHYVARKGSIAIDGVSLTVNAENESRFEVNIVPHTLRATIIGTYEIGTAVNIEVDIVARYLERLIRGAGANGAGIWDKQT